MTLKKKRIINENVFLSIISLSVQVLITAINIQVTPLRTPIHNNDISSLARPEQFLCQKTCTRFLYDKYLVVDDDKDNYTIWDVPVDV